MNKYPIWLNLTVLAVFLAGGFLALPNLYGSSSAVQLAAAGEGEVSASMLGEYVRVLESRDIDVHGAYLDDARAIVRLADPGDQQRAVDLLRERFAPDVNAALTLAPRMPDWLRALGLRPMSLGLDLRGGVYVLLEVDMDTAIGNRLEAYQQDFIDRLRAARIRHRVDLNGELISVRVQSPADLEAARRLLRDADQDILITDSADGRALNLRMSEAQIKARQDFAIEQNMTTLRNRVDSLGVAEPLVQRQGVDRIVVQLPGVQDSTELDRILTATATLEFRLVDQSGDEPGSRRYPGRSSVADQVLKRDVIASGEQMVDAAAGLSADGQPAVFITLDSAGGENMLETTQNNLGRPMSTLFIEWREDTVRIGDRTETRRVKTEEIINTAAIQGVFKNRFQVTGLTSAEASALAKLLRAGALAAPVYKIDERTIGPTLGQDNIDRGFRAIVIGFLSVIVFMAIYYRWFGLIANVALLSNLVFIVAVLSLFGASLTLPGIAGIVLTVGMAVDANVLIFERIREEISSGAAPQTAIHSGYDKALSSIADANITTLIAAIVLFAFGTGPIKGFAITLTIGIVTSMFTAIVGTRAIVNLAFGSRKIQSVPV